MWNRKKSHQKWKMLSDIEDRVAQFVMQKGSTQLEKLKEKQRDTGTNDVCMCLCMCEARIDRKALLTVMSLQKDECNVSTKNSSTSIQLCAVCLFNGKESR